MCILQARISAPTDEMKFGESIIAASQNLGHRSSADILPICLSEILALPIFLSASHLS
jgi:hypothetical protein